MFRRRTSIPEPEHGLDHPGPPDHEVLLDLINEVEQAAFDIYRRNGLPDRRGEYMRGPRARKWAFVAPRLSAEEKWALLERQSLGAGWRYGNLETIGHLSDSREVHLASGVLGACRGLRRRADALQPPTFQDLADALRLGDTYRQMASASETPSQARAPRRARTRA